MIDMAKARPGSLESAYDASATLRYIAPAGHTLEMCRHPLYWSNNLREVGRQRVTGRHAWNKIEILAEDGTWEAELRVMSVVDGQVHTRLLREYHEASKPGRRPTVPDGYVIEHIPHNGWRALAPDGTVVSEKLPVEADAIRAASRHSKMVDA